MTPKLCEVKKNCRDKALIVLNGVQDFYHQGDIDMQNKVNTVSLTF